MNTTELRKQVSRKLKDGSIEQCGLSKKPAQPSRVIYNLKKNDLQNIIDNNVINWAELDETIWQCEKQNGANDSDKNSGSSETSASSEPPSPYEDESESESERSESENESDAEKFDAEMEIHKSNFSRKYVTSDGLIEKTDLMSDIGIDVITDNVKKALENGGNGGGNIVIKLNDVKTIELKDEHLHPLFEQILNHVKWDKNVYLYGSAGAGKTTIAMQIKKALDLDRFACYSCTAGMSEGLITGRLLFDGSFFSTDFIDCWENGGVILLDEFDAMDGNMAVVMNSALANGILDVPNRREKTKAMRHNDCYVIGAGNTDGSGNGSRIYAGRNKLDGATLDRFTTINFEYDKKLEKKLSGGHSDLYKALNQLRKNVDKYELNRIISTRQFLKCARWMSGGMDLKYCLKMITSSWTEFEIEKVELDKIMAGDPVKKVENVKKV